MNERNKLLIQKYFEKESIVSSLLNSYNHFVDYDLKKIIEQNNPIEPPIIPPTVDDYTIYFDKIRLGTPQIIEADGSVKKIFPSEARLRNITYSAPVYLTVSSYINGRISESFEVQVGLLPIMIKSKYCFLHGLSREELIEHGEDPDDPGGYFIINGSERVIVRIEDLAANHFTVTKASLGPSKYVGKIFSETGAYKIPHSIEQLKDGIISVSFTRVKRAPVTLVLKALGMVNDAEIMNYIGNGKEYPEIIANLYNTINLKTREDALDALAKKIGVSQSRDIRIERTENLLDRFFLPHLGSDADSRRVKAIELTKLVRKFIRVERKELSVDDIDHYSNKRIKLAGDLLGYLFDVNIKVLINDLLYTFQRIVKRGKFPSVNVIIREKLLTSRIQSAMATGNWVGGRTGVSQRLQRWNFLEFLSHLQRVISPLSTSQENFAARALHSTHYGRLCPVETPEGSSIGLKKNLAMFAKISGDNDDKEVMKALEDAGLKEI
ncbi:MAG: DNA-directed RNA polymerase subunit B'' [Nitrospiraceae bacterium]|nr:DNA-directed RNA polymerase subunit B'' [Nitrospiraceae bacterium]